ncbi:MAG: ceramidase domain-containing protein [Rhodovibrio sp.]|nr:ceramidase domain-containing protein [Rhodovibrio sp.]
MNGWDQRIDIYCERMGPQFWAEPVNALTNAAFLIAAAWVFVVLRREGRLEAGTGLLLALLTAIGIGSFLFHTIATRWAALADVLPIMLFILAYLALTMRRGFQLNWWWAGGITLAFLPASFAVSALVGQLAGGALGGSGGYVPALLALLIAGGWLWARGVRDGQWLLAAAAVFVASITLRTLDQPLCQATPFGTHFMWHVLNAGVLGLLIWALSRMPGAPGKSV